MLIFVTFVLELETVAPVAVYDASFKFTFKLKIKQYLFKKIVIE